MKEVSRPSGSLLALFPSSPPFCRRAPSRRGHLAELQAAQQKGQLRGTSSGTRFRPQKRPASRGHLQFGRTVKLWIGRASLGDAFVETAGCGTTYLGGPSRAAVQLQKMTPDPAPKQGPKSGIDFGAAQWRNSIGKGQKQGPDSGPRNWAAQIESSAVTARNPM